MGVEKKAVGDFEKVKDQREENPIIMIFVGGGAEAAVFATLAS